MKFDPVIRKKIENDEKIIKFAKKRKFKQRSWDILILKFLYFYEATKDEEKGIPGLLPSEAIEEAGREEDEGIPLRRSKLVQHLDDFEDYLEDNYAHTTRQYAMGTVRSFYKRYKIVLPESERIVRDKEKVILTVQDLPNKDDVKQVLTLATVRDKAIIIMGVSAGLGKAEIRNLKMGDLLDAINRKNTDRKLELKDLVHVWEDRPKWLETVNPLIWYAKRIKTSKHFFTFSTPESLELILDYLRKYPPKKLEPDTPLFRTYVEDTKIGQRRYNNIYTYYNRQCGFGKAKDDKIYFRSHNMRKLYGNQLKKAIGYLDADKLLAHADKNRTREDYLKADIVDLYDKYYENMGLVTITYDLSVATSTKKEFDEYKKKTEEQRIKDKEEYDRKLREKEERHQRELEEERTQREKDRKRMDALEEKYNIWLLTQKREKKLDEEENK